MRVPILLTACVFLPSVAAAQNLLINGDFAATTPAPWTASGPGWNPGVFIFDTNGTGASRSFAVSPGMNQPDSVTQNVVVAPLTYELSIDIAVTAPATSISLRLPTVTVKVGTATVASHAFVFARQMPTRRRLCARFKPTQAGQVPVAVEFLFSGNPNANTARVYVDNVVLAVARNPMFCISGERRLGTAMSFDVEGTPQAPFVVLLAPSLLPKPVRIPGVGGELEVDPTILATPLAGQLDASGKFTVAVTIPNLPGLAGVPLFWQGLEVNSGGPTLGWASLVGFY